MIYFHEKNKNVFQTVTFSKSIIVYSLPYILLLVDCPTQFIHIWISICTNKNRYSRVICLYFMSHLRVQFWKLKFDVLEVAIMKQIDSANMNNPIFPA